ncbi:hypothetical protein [Tsukamurella paurometabola]|uniref:Uncharacterized protein n=1 Tax=Tsukamurella paurometabola TaxID=2061 RepID=A0ABS5NDQ7_TSUPA|nr:hypothetical protein [Tsukamurella paurometabola]MBS4101588.1 hypothetical protein [Tsukamurella paurometabola]
MVQRFLDYEMRVSEFLGLLILIAIPYGIIGLIWSLTHMDHLGDLSGIDRIVSFLGAVVCWPVLLFANVTMQ